MKVVLSVKSSNIPWMRPKFGGFEEVTHRVKWMDCGRFYLMFIFRRGGYNVSRMA